MVTRTDRIGYKDMRVLDSSRLLSVVDPLVSKFLLHAEKSICGVSFFPPGVLMVHEATDFHILEFHFLLPSTVRRPILNNSHRAMRDLMVERRIKFERRW
jgi:hypothetical protein